MQLYSSFLNNGTFPHTLLMSAVECVWVLCDLIFFQFKSVFGRTRVYCLSLTKELPILWLFPILLSAATFMWHWIQQSNLIVSLAYFLIPNSLQICYKNFQLLKKNIQLTIERDDKPETTLAESVPLESTHRMQLRIHNWMGNNSYSCQNIYLHIEIQTLVHIYAHASQCPIIYSMH